MSMVTVYFLTRVGAFGTYFTFCGWVIPLLGVLWMITRSIAWDDNKTHENSLSADRSKRAALVCVVVGFLFGALGAATPTTKEMVAIVGVQAITNIEGIDKVPENVVHLINNWMEVVTPAVEEVVE